MSSAGGAATGSEGARHTWPSSVPRARVRLTKKAPSLRNLSLSNSQSMGCVPARERVHCGVCVSNARPVPRAAAAPLPPPRVGSPGGTLGVAEASDERTGGRRLSNGKRNGDWQVHFSFHSLSKRSLSASRTPSCDARQDATRVGERRTGPRYSPSCSRCWRCPGFLHKVITMTAHAGRQHAHRHGQQRTEIRYARPELWFHPETKRDRSLSNGRFST